MSAAAAMHAQKVARERAHAYAQVQAQRAAHAAHAAAVAAVAAPAPVAVAAPVAAAAPQPPAYTPTIDELIPEGWVQLWSQREQAPYWKNEYTGVVSWTPPIDFLPGWSYKWSVRAQAPYYVNSYTGETTWTMPLGHRGGYKKKAKKTRKSKRHTRRR